MLFRAVGIVERGWRASVWAERDSSDVDSLDRVGRHKKTADFRRSGRFGKNEDVFGLVGSSSNDVHTCAVFVKEHLAIAESEERVVFAHADVYARSPACAALADDDVASDDSLATVFFHAETFAA